MAPKRNGRAEAVKLRNTLAAEAKACGEILKNDATDGDAAAGPNWEPSATDEHERTAADAPA